MKLNRFLYFTKYDSEEVQVRLLVLFKRLGVWQVKSKSGIVLRDAGNAGRFLDTVAITGMIMNFALDKSGEKELKIFWDRAYELMGKHSGKMGAFV